MERLAGNDGFVVVALERLPSIHVITDDRPPGVGEMDANLVGASGLEFEFNEREVLEADGAVMVAVSLVDTANGDAWFAEVVVADDLLFAVSLGAAWVGADGLVDDLAIGFDAALDEGKVAFVGGAFLKLGGDFPVGLFGLGEDDAPGGVAVEAMDDTGTGELVADA